MKSKFEHNITTSSGKFILRGKLHEAERFSLCLIRNELSDRWTKDFNPLFIHSICEKVGNIKKMMVIWEILYKYTEEEDSQYHLDCIFHPEKDENDEKIYLIIEERTEYQTVKIPLPLDHTPFTLEEYQANCKFLYNRINQLECIRLSREKEIVELKSQLFKERENSAQSKSKMKSCIKKLQTRITFNEQRELDERLSKPKSSTHCSKRSSRCKGRSSTTEVFLSEQ